MNYSMNSEHLRKFGNYKNDIMNDIFLIKPPPPVTKVVGKFFYTPDRINFYAATFCCDECCNPEHRWKFFVILLHRLLQWYSFHYRHLTHDDDTDRHFVCFSIDTMIFSSVFLRISMQDIFQTVIILTFFEIQIETGIYENRLVTSDICIKIKVNHPSELEHN